MGTSEPVIPSSLFQVGGAGRIVRKKPLEPRKRFRERKIISIENVHSQPPIRFTPTLDVVGVGVKRIGTENSMSIAEEIAAHLDNDTNISDTGAKLFQLYREAERYNGSATQLDILISIYK